MKTKLSKSNIKVGDYVIMLKDRIDESHYFKEVFIVESVLNLFNESRINIGLTLYEKCPIYGHVRSSNYILDTYFRVLTESEMKKYKRNLKLEKLGIV